MAINHMLRKEQAQAMEDMSFIPTTTKSSELSAEQKERAQLLQEICSHLRANDREVLHCFYYRGMSLKEISSETNAPVGTIKRRLHTARNRLREALSLRGIAKKDF
jgi:RNA polymerase sigma-70 factor (ECF subfamily)